MQLKSTATSQKPFLKSTHLQRSELFLSLDGGKEMQKKTNEIRVEFPKEMLGGAYSNNMAVSHTREEFIMDFLMITPPSGTVTGRIVVSPGHIKRIVKALVDNIARYEEKFGAIQSAEEPVGSITLQ